MEKQSEKYLKEYLKQLYIFSYILFVYSFNHKL